MNRILLLIVLLTIMANPLLAQKVYAVELVPPELLKDANVVKRMEEIFIEIKDIGKATITKKYCITILNKAGDEAADFVMPYSKFSAVSAIDGTLYDGSGKKIRSLKNADIRDYSDTDEGTLADDSRVKQHNFNYNIYPYSVEYETVTKLNGIFFLPAWVPVADDHYAVEKSSLLVQCPTSYQLRYKKFNYAGEPVEKADAKTKTYQWEVKQVQAFKQPPLSPSWQQLTPTVFLAPGDFELQDFNGNMNDWAGFGKFIYTLNKGRDKLPENIKNDLRQLTMQLTDNTSKVRAVYEYLQKNTRYISIQLGIGGWQTFDAGYVAEKKYGDCKALSNYMYSMLKEIGIRSNYVLIQSGNNKNRFMADFPSNQFNHMILCVPQQKDSIWLECTSQTLPAGYLSNFTSDRYALLIDSSGGKIVHTPRYGKNENTQFRKITAVMNENGHVKASVNTTYAAWQQEYYQGMINALSKEKILEQLKEQLDIPSYDVERFEYNEKKLLPPVVEENLLLQLNHYVTITGKRIFINPNIMNRFSALYREDENRTVPVEVLNGYTDVDSVEIEIPSGYKPENMPSGFSMQSLFGSYQTSFNYQPGKITYFRRIERNDGQFPPASYHDLADFFNKVYKADRAKIVLVKE